MNLSLHTRHQAADRFDSERLKAIRQRWLGALAGKNGLVKNYEDIAPLVSEEKKYTGITAIPLEAIRGSLGRANDFDARFRPLRKHMQSRWVTVALAWNSPGWEAIQVYQIGSEYYVLDGHHRVSVAAAMGLRFIDAEVWQCSLRPACQDCPLRQPAARAALASEGCHS